MLVAGGAAGGAAPAGAAAASSTKTLSAHTGRASTTSRHDASTGVAPAPAEKVAAACAASAHTGVMSVGTSAAVPLPRARYHRRSCTLATAAGRPDQATLTLPSAAVVRGETAPASGEDPAGRTPHSGPQAALKSARGSALAQPASSRSARARGAMAGARNARGSTPSPFFYSAGGQCVPPRIFFFPRQTPANAPSVSPPPRFSSLSIP